MIIEYSNGTSQNAGHMKDTDVYTVTFHVDDEIVATRNVFKGDKVSRPTLEETAGYTITDWYLIDCGANISWKFDGYFAYTVHDHIDLYAEFTYNEYTIKFVDNNHQHHVESLKVFYDHEYVLPEISQTGYTFSGWKDSSDSMFVDGVYRIARDITLYAVWDANTYNVTLNPNGGSIDNTSMQVIYDAQYTLPIPTRLNYIFLGWFDGDTKISNSATWKFAENKTFTAKWTNVTNTYVFDAGDGLCDINSMVIGWEDSYTLPTPTSESLVFNGWYLGETKIPQSGTWTYSNSGGILVAKWNSPLTIKDNVVTKCSKSVSVVNVPDNVTSIGKYAFENCTSLTSITIPDSVISIGSYAFSGCTSLTSITIPDSVTSIGSSAFYNSNINDIFFVINSIENFLNINVVKSNLRGNVHLLDVNGFEMTEVVIPDGVTSINDFAFYNCTSLTSITIPDGVTSIGEWVFQNCTSLTSITIPDSVTSIYRGAFYNCTSLTSIIIPSSVTSIGDFAFSDCTSLTSLTIPSSVTSIGEWVFQNCTCTINCYAKSKPSGWSDNWNYCFKGTIVWGYEGE